MNITPDVVLSATVHGVKNQLGELLWRLEARGDCLLEQSIALRCAQRLSSALLLWRGEQSTWSLNLEAVDPAELLDELVVEYRALFPLLQIELTDSASSGVIPRLAFMDRAMVGLVLSDIVHNACRAASHRVSLSFSPWQQGVCLQVCDDGAGYPQDVLRSAGASLHQVAEGQTGLGLFLAAMVAKAHRRDAQTGAIALHNANGACFRMLLP